LPEGEVALQFYPIGPVRACGKSLAPATSLLLLLRLRQQLVHIHPQLLSAVALVWRQFLQHLGFAHASEGGVLLSVKPQESGRRLQQVRGFLPQFLVPDVFLPVVGNRLVAEDFKGNGEVRVALLELLGHFDKSPRSRKLVGTSASKRQAKLLSSLVIVTLELDY
jgi:hypothetical protein